MTGLEVVLYVEGPVGVLTLAGEARLEVIHDLEVPAAEALAGGARSLILDLARLEFMDSASTGTLIRLDQDATARGGRMVLCAVPRVIQRLFQAAGLQGRFQEAPDLEKAREILSRG
jgi:stage II sporulation protein AA (anti-sigma F factor antagonist)